MPGITKVAARESSDPRGYLAALAWTLGGTLLGIVLITGSGNPGTTPGTDRAVRVTEVMAATSPETPSLQTKGIEDIRVGERVLGRNPLLSNEERGVPEPDPETWRKIELRMAMRDGHCLNITLLRPLGWVEATGAEAGRAIALDLPEMGASGPADVLAIDSCPEIGPGDGQVVTGTFVHEGAPVVDVHIYGLAEPIGCTANHPFWSEDRKSFVPAGGLHTGERVRTRSRGIVAITSIIPRNEVRAVYNLEVHGEHVYEVSEIGVLVHNQCEVNEETIRRAMEGAGLRTQQKAASIPVIERYVRRLEANEVPPEIHIDRDIIVDGNHRYIAGRLVGQEPPQIDWPGGDPNRAIPWDQVFLDPVDWGNR